MRKALVLCLVLFVGSVYITSCFVNKKEVHPSQLDFALFPLKTLSEYGLLKGELKQLTANDGVLEYEPISPLFTDYAKKSRFIWMPEGTAAEMDISQPNEPFNFPNKSILVKNFYYPSDFSKPEGERRIIETRLLVKMEDGWKAFPYVWNDEQTDAKYKVTGGIYDVHWKDEKGDHDIKYAMPNKNQCKSCHNQNDEFKPIGPKIKQLNNELTYSDGTKMNQLEKWTSMGYLKGYNKGDSYPTLFAMDNDKSSKGDRARSYLDANCSHCHNLQGPASTSGLYLNYEENDPFHWGVLKSPVAAGIGAGEHKFAIFPGHGEESIIAYRMNSVNPGVMMPEIGRVSIHTEGVALVKEWINGMEEVKK
ncbi:conserved hypothetical protein, HNE_0200 family [Spirosomataceae bacterium TFI 002]|nr:conserved hypothetical protein, HNE_0200 family [Spirosomataceae bacterium TFI 002]